MSKELGIPVLALSQLSRDVEKRGNSKRPVLSDLRESGAIEQDADIVMFVYRPEYYGIEPEGGYATEGLAEVIVAKHRAGSTGDVRLRFISKYVRFENMSGGVSAFDGIKTLSSRMNDEERVSNNDAGANVNGFYNEGESPF